MSFSLKEKVFLLEGLFTSCNYSKIHNPDESWMGERKEIYSDKWIFTGRDEVGKRVGFVWLREDENIVSYEFYKDDFKKKLCGDWTDDINLKEIGNFMNVLNLD